MYEMIRNLIFVIVASAFISCSNDCVKIIREAETTDTMSLKPIKLSKELFMPTRLIATSGKLIVYQRKGDDMLIEIDCSTSYQQRIIAKKGRASNEFVNIDVQSFKPTKGGFICMDAGGKVKNVSIDNRITINSEQIPTWGNPQNGIIVNSSFISANVVNDNSEYICYNKSLDSPDYFSKYPNWTECSEIPLAFLYMKNMVSHPTEDKFAAFYVNFRKVRILNLMGDLLYDVDVQVPDVFPPYSQFSEHRVLAYASYPCATNQFIYSLCLNRNVNPAINNNPEIHIWDWYGNLKKRITLDKHIDIFTVSEDDNTLYGMNVNYPDILYYQHLRK